MVHKTLHKKLKIEQVEPHQKTGYPGSLNSSCSTNNTHGVTLVSNPVISYDGGKDDGNVTITIRTHLWQTYSVTVNHDLMATLKLYKWWLQEEFEDTKSGNQNP